jgi:hypothetical protein
VTATERQAQIKAAEAEYQRIIADGESPAAAFAEGAADILAARAQTPKLVQLIKLFEVVFAEALDGVNRADVVGAHIPTEILTYPNGRVELDVVGNLVAVEFDERVELS